MRLRTLGLLVSVAVGCATAQPYFNYAAEPNPRARGFVVGPSDVLRVTVWHNPDLSGEVTVRPDGTITIPLIGDLPVAGQTPAEVRDEIARRLKAFVKDESAIVTVAVTATNSYRFTVVGNVEHQGTFNANHYVTVSEAITLAGGPSKFASPEDSVIIRTSANGAVRRIPVDYLGILSGNKTQQDLTLVAGDKIYVP